MLLSSHVISGIMYIQPVYIITLHRGPDLPVRVYFVITIRCMHIIVYLSYIYSILLQYHMSKNTVVLNLAVRTRSQCDIALMILKE